MTVSNSAILVVVALGIASVAVEKFVAAPMQAQFIQLEKERLDITNKLATAKIVQENLNHVTDLLTKNMEAAGASAENHESDLYEFLTESVNDLKIKLISIKPERPVTEGEISSYVYNMELEADFFTLGELCAKFENCRRIISVEEIDVTEIAPEQRLSESHTVRVTMKIKSYLIRRAQQ